MSAGSVDGPDSVEAPSNDAVKVSSVGRVLYRRSWPQRLLIAVNLLLAVVLFFGASRLGSFEEAVGSIIRIDVPAGVLADLDVPIGAAGSESDDEIDSGSKAVPVDDDRPAPPRNILLIGTDSAVGLEEDDPAGQRDRNPGVALADAIMLLRLDPQLGTASLVSLPRDLHVMIYRQGVPVRAEKLASALLVGGMELGAPTLVETVTRNFGVPIHNFVVIDFLGFEAVVEEIGGVSVWFPYPTRDVGSGLYIAESGCAELDGQASLAFVRSRKLELFVDGYWQRVGVWNDLERNQRQQDFLTLALERVVDIGARSIIVRDDLIEAAARSVVLDDRLTLRTLLGLGNAFAGFDPTDLTRHTLPVYDDTVGSASVLRLRDGARRVFDVFRGITLRPEDVPVVVVDGRGLVEESVPAHAQLVLKGFPVVAESGAPVDVTTIRTHRDQFAAAVLVAQMVTPTPQFVFVDDSNFSDRLELTLGKDFASFLLVPRDLDEVDALARVALPTRDGEGTRENSATGLMEEGLSGWAADALPIRSETRVPAEVPSTVDGRRPDGSSCS
ncbi:MAG: LCP family protein [Acidimicrobiales bacterium]|nr:LCP family protein [Acidimicrobiales bacterium]